MQDIGLYGKDRQAFAGNYIMIFKKSMKDGKED